MLVDPFVQNLFRGWRKKLSSPKATPFPLRSISGRLFLQPFQQSEVSLVKKWFDDQTTCELAFGVKAPWDVLDSMRTEYIAELQKDKLGVLSVLLQSSCPTETVGFVRYKLFSRGRQKSARVGIILGPTTIRGQGVGREAFQTLLSYLFERKGVATVELDTAIFNTAAQKCFEACGFQVIREVEFTSLATNWTERRLMMRLTRAQWEARGH